MYFATLLKTTAPVKLPISQFSLISLDYVVRNILTNYNLSFFIKATFKYFNFLHAK